MTTLMEKMRAAKAGLADARSISPARRLRRIRDRHRRDVDQSGGVPAKYAWATRRRDLAEVEISLVTADGPDREVDWMLACLVGAKESDNDWPAFTASLDAARGFVAQTLPGFFVSSGLCALTGHASLGPDYNGPEGERLRQDWPLDGSYGVWDEDLAPGDGPHRECYAILACAVRTLAHRHEATRP